MSRFVSNLKLLHKLALPGAVLVLAAIAMVVTAQHWLTAVEERIATVIDRDAKRQELALRIVGDVNLITVASRDVRTAAKVEEVEAVAGQATALRNQVEQALETLVPLMIDPEQRRIAEMAKTVFKEFVEITLDNAAEKVTSLKTGSVAPGGGRGRIVRTQLDEMLLKIVKISQDEMQRARGEAIAVGRSAAATLVFGAGSAQLLALALLAWIAIAQVARPLGRMTAAMGRLASGDLDVAVDGAERRDEVGALGRALAVFKENAAEARRLEAAQRAEQRRKEQRAETVDAQIRVFEGSANAALGAVTAAAGEMRSTSAGMSATAEQSGQLAAAVLASCEQASSNVRSVAAATEELSASVGEIGSQVSHAATIAGKAVHETEETDARVRSLTEAASRIGEVVEMIASIASQTNLLALNATIEAARAGDAGKGFAVVASEVKSLAMQTAKATEEITGQVGAIQAATGSVVSAIKTIGGTIAEVSEVASAISAAVEEQGAAVREIARSTQEAASSAADVAANIAGVSKAAGDTRSAAAQELAAADALAGQAAALRGEVDTFLANIRAA